MGKIGEKIFHNLTWERWRLQHIPTNIPTNNATDRRTIAMECK